MNTSRRNFDLPATHLNDTDGSNYVPPKARDEQEIARRQELRPGSLIREYQSSGTKVAEAVFSHPVHEPEDILYIRQRLAVPLLNSAWYAFADSDTNPEIFMRRVLKLPELANDSREWRASKELLIGKVRHGLSHSALLAENVRLLHGRGFEQRRSEKEKDLGRTMGTTALHLINLQNANAPLGMSEQQIQHAVMMYGLDLLKDARVSHASSGGYHASIAQLAHPDSPFSRDWRDSAPRSGEALRALIQSQEDFGLTA